MTNSNAYGRILHHVAIQKKHVMVSSQSMVAQGLDRSAGYTEVPSTSRQHGEPPFFSDEFLVPSFSLAMKLCGPLRESLQGQTVQSHWMEFLPSWKWIL